MPNTTVNLVKGTIPSSACFSSVQALYDLVIDSTTAHVKGEYSLFNFGDTVPAVSDQDKPWIRTIGNAPDKVYVYESGYWLSLHPVPIGSQERRIWTGTTAELAGYDGGDTGSISAFTGPFWEVDTDFSAVFPVGVGTFASGTQVNAGNTGGVEEVTLTTAQMPEHSHDFTLNGYNSSQDSNTGNEYGFDGKSPQSLKTDNTGSGEAHNNLPPYRGVYFIKRTGRQYYTAG